MISETKATFKLGIQFVDWGAPGESYIHGFGKIGRDMLWLHPHQLWLAARERAPGSVKHFDHYSIAGAASLRNRFAFPDKRNPNSPIADLEYAYHFDASLFARFLRAESEARGVTRVEGRIVEVIQDPETRLRHSACGCTDGRERRRRPVRRLLGHACAADRRRARRRLRALEQVAALRPRTCRSMRERLAAHALTCGARRARQAGNGASRCSTGSAMATSIRRTLISDDEAAATLLSSLDGAPLADPRPVRFAPGVRAKAWEKNVVAIGLSSGFLEPLESTSIHLIQTGIHRLLALFPATGFSQPDINEYNRQARFEFEDVRDFIIAHYNVTRRSGEPFWDYVRTMDVPDSLNERYELFRSSGRFFKHGAAELFAEESWVQVLLGQGFEAKADPVAQFVPTEEIVGFLNDMAEVIADVAETMPDHGEFVSRLPSSTPKAQEAVATSTLMHNLAEVHR